MLLLVDVDVVLSLVVVADCVELDFELIDVVDLLDTLVVETLVVLTLVVVAD